MFIKCFNLSFNPPPTRSNGKEKIWADLFRKCFFGKQIWFLLSGNQQFSLQKLAAEAQSIPKHFVDIPTVQFSSQDSKYASAAVALPSRDSQALALAPVSRRNQQEH